MDAAAERNPVSIRFILSEENERADKGWDRE